MALTEFEKSLGAREVGAPAMPVTPAQPTAPKSFFNDNWLGKSIKAVGNFGVGVGKGAADTLLSVPRNVEKVVQSAVDVSEQSRFNKLRQSINEQNDMLLAEYRKLPPGDPRREKYATLIQQNNDQFMMLSEQEKEVRAQVKKDASFIPGDEGGEAQKIFDKTVAPSNDAQALGFKAEKIGELIVPSVALSKADKAITGMKLVSDASKGGRIINSTARILGKGTLEGATAAASTVGQAGYQGRLDTEAGREGVVEDATRNALFAGGAKMLMAGAGEIIKGVKPVDVYKNEAISDLISPSTTGKKGSDILKSSNVKVADGGIFKRTKVDFTKDPRNAELVDTVKDIVDPTKSVAHNFNAVKESIETVADKEVKPFLTKNKVPFNFEDLQVRLSKIQPTGSLKADAGAFETYSRVREEMADDIATYLRKSGNVENITDMNELWNARKVIDGRIQKELGTATFGTPQYTGAKAAALDMRRAINDFVSDSLSNPGQAEEINRLYDFLAAARSRGIKVDTQGEAIKVLRQQMGINDIPEEIAKGVYFKMQLDKMSKMYEVVDNLVPKVKKEIGKNAFEKLTYNGILSALGKGADYFQTPAFKLKASSIGDSTAKGVAVRRVLPEVYDASVTPEF